MTERTGQEAGETTDMFDVFLVAERSGLEMGETTDLLYVFLLCLGELEKISQGDN